MGKIVPHAAVPAGSSVGHGAVLAFAAVAEPPAGASAAAAGVPEPPGPADDDRLQDLDFQGRRSQGG